MSEKAREKAREHGQKSGKGNQTVSRFLAWAADLVGSDDDSSTSDDE